MFLDFDDRGYLPPGIHSATLAEIDERFGHESELRRAQMQSLLWLVEIAKRARVERKVINGSFVTDVMEPNDVDCALLAGRGFAEDSTAAAELADGLPFLQIELLNAEDFALMVTSVYASDRNDVPKGVVEIMAWN